MESKPDPWRAILYRLTLLKEAWPPQPWSWDARFVAVVSSFHRDQESAVTEAVTHAFPRSWTTKSLETAPMALRMLAASTGGLRPGQRLLAGDEKTAAALFGLWWPWGGGETISLRIGVADLEAHRDPIPRIRELFGATK